jgi:hypothetical protein
LHHDQHGKRDIGPLASPAITNGREEKPVTQVFEAVALAERLDLILGHDAVDSLGCRVGDDQGGELFALLDLCQEFIGWIGGSVELHVRGPQGFGTAALTLATTRPHIFGALERRCCTVLWLMEPDSRAWQLWTDQGSHNATTTFDGRRSAAAPTSFSGSWGEPLGNESVQHKTSVGTFGEKI